MANVTYTVKSGDTLTKIANQYKDQYYSGKTTSQVITAIKNLNPSIIKDINKIYVGDTLLIYSDTGTPATTDDTKTSSTAYDLTVSLQADTKRTLLARWKWSKNSTTDYYLVRWWYGTESTDNGNGILAVEDQHVSTAWLAHEWTAPDNARRVSFCVKPIAKTTTQGDTEVAQWTVDWAILKPAYLFDTNAAMNISAPDVKIDGNTMTITLDNIDVDATAVRFKIVKNNTDETITEDLPIKYGSISYTCTVEPGNEYKVAAQAIRDGAESEWSSFSSIAGTVPTASSGIITCRAKSSTSVYLEWGAVSNADTYEIEYTTKEEYFDTSDEVSSKTGITSTSYIITGLGGERYYFRVRAVNENGESAWTAVASVVVGKKPSAPTTWSSTTIAVSGETLYLYWVHNSEDGSKQQSAELELDINGTIETHTIDNPTFEDDEAEEVTSTYEFDTTPYVEGTKLLWRVRTCGVTGEYGDWSMQRQVDIYGKPTLDLTLTASDGNRMSILEQFPFNVTGIAGPSTQKPISYHLSVVANETYDTVDQLGNDLIVSKGTELYSKYFDIETDLNVDLSANDIDLANGISYSVNCIVTMNSGLNAEESKTFTVMWEEIEYFPNAAIGIDKNTYTAIISPYCEDAYGSLYEGVTLAVYRREYNGSFTEIATNLPNKHDCYVTDPHPALDFARYRIVARHEATGAIGFHDTMTYSGGKAPIIIQWDEKWTNFEVTEDGLSEEQYPWSGSMLKLPYNIDVSPSYQPDVVMIEYIGRKHPVSYYGTQLGEAATWKVDIPKSDKETIYGLRRLAAWMGDAYVREPNGSGYWANITVNFSLTHCEVVVPVTLEITRVEGGA